jgi:hypothetical protein
VESFFFQKGCADLYAEALCGELKVDEFGTSVLVGLANRVREDVIFRNILKMLSDFPEKTSLIKGVEK